MLFIKKNILKLYYRKPIYDLRLILKEIQGC
jgi:hypothetical protein